jgi:hypothetical protein
MRSFSTILLLSMTACDSSRPPIDPTDPTDAGAPAAELQRYDVSFAVGSAVCFDLNAARSLECDLGRGAFDLAFTWRDVVIAHAGASTDVALWEGPFESLDDVPEASRCPPWQDLATIPSDDAVAGAGLWVGAPDSGSLHRLRISGYERRRDAIGFTIEHLPPER